MASQDDQPTAWDPAIAESSVEVLRRAQAGDRAALERLFEIHRPRMRRWAAGRLPAWARDMVDTDDMIQDTLLRTFGQLERFEPRHDGALQAYLRQAVRNRIQDEVRRAQVRPGPDELRTDEADRGASPLEAAIGAEALEAYERALAGLDEDQRDAVVARIELGLDYAEIARLVGKPSADAARMVVSRALVRLAREMGHGRG